MNQQIPALRDIHLPAAISWWPLAWGWWLVLALCIALFVALLVYIEYRRRPRPAAKVALSRQDFVAELLRIEHRFVHSEQSQSDKTELAASISMLLRQTVLQESANQAAAQLTGSAWLKALDQHFGIADKTHNFTSSTGVALVEAPYRPNYQYDSANLLKLSYYALAQALPNTDKVS